MGKLLGVKHLVVLGACSWALQTLAASSKATIPALDPRNLNHRGPQATNLPSVECVFPSYFGRARPGRKKMGKNGCFVEDDFFPFDIPFHINDILGGSSQLVSG